MLQDAIARIEGYRYFFEAAREAPGDEGVEESTKDSIRSDMIRYINEISDDSRAILTEKVETGQLEDCQQEKLDLYTQIKPPLWMLVNTTIFAPSLEALEEMVVAMADQLDVLLATYCSESPRPVVVVGPEGPNCEWEEYEATKKYLAKVDEIIQEALFKAKEEKAQMTALLGFVDVQVRVILNLRRMTHVCQGLMDKRVKVLFESSLVCPDEVTFIKKEYM